MINQAILNKLSNYSLDKRRNKDYIQHRKLSNEDLKFTIQELKVDNEEIKHDCIKF